MAHVYDHQVEIAESEHVQQVCVGSFRTKAEAEAMLSLLQNAGHDCFIESHLVKLDEASIVNDIMRGAIGDLVFGSFERKSEYAYDVKHGLFRPDEHTEAKDTKMLAYMDTDRSTGEISWKLTSEGIEHYLENYGIRNESLVMHLRSVARLRAEWTIGYVARLYTGMHSKPASK